MTGGRAGARGRAQDRCRRTAIRTRRIASTAARAGWRILLCLRAEGARPPHARGLLPRPSRTACFNFEGKIWRTLPLLAWRPGRADAPLHRRASARRFVSPDRAVPVLGFPDVRRAQLPRLTRNPRQRPSTCGRASNDRASRSQKKLARTRSQARERTRRGRQADVAEHRPTRIAERRTEAHGVIPEKAASRPAKRRSERQISTVEELDEWFRHVVAEGARRIRRC